MTAYKTKYWLVTKQSQTPSSPAITFSQDSWSGLKMNLNCASGSDTSVTLQLLITDEIDNQAIYRNTKLFSFTVNLKNVAPSQITLSTDLIKKGITNIINSKIFFLYKYVYSFVRVIFPSVLFFKKDSKLFSSWWNF